MQHTACSSFAWAYFFLFWGGGKPPAPPVQPNSFLGVMLSDRLLIYTCICKYECERPQTWLNVMGHSGPVCKPGHKRLIFTPLEKQVSRCVRIFSTWTCSPTITHTHSQSWQALLCCESWICISILVQETLVCTSDLPDPALWLVLRVFVHACLSLVLPVTAVFLQKCYFSVLSLFIWQAPPFVFRLSIVHFFSNLTNVISAETSLSSMCPPPNTHTHTLVSHASIPGLYLWAVPGSCGDWISTTIYVGEAEDG